MFRCSLFLLVLALLAGIVSPPALAETRVALVVGNSDYHGDNVRQLANPQSDARLIAQALKSVGFELVGGEAQLNLDKSAFEKAVRDFGTALRRADVGVFYYAGHGVQVDGQNYLVPVDANPERPADVGLQLLNAKLVLAQMEGSKLSIVILDACRNDPFTSGRSLALGRGRSGTVLRDIGKPQGGLAQMEAPPGTMIWFSTQPGAVAEDGPDGDNSPFAKALAEAIRTPGLDLYRTFDQAGDAVTTATGGRQVPWEARSPLRYSFYFTAPGGSHSTPLTIAAAPVARPSSPISSASSGADIARKYETNAHVASVGPNGAASQLPQAGGANAAVPVRTGALSPGDERSLKPSEHFRECKECPEMVAIPVGKFVMGSSASEPGHEADEGPQQQIAFAHMFAVGVSAVTFDEWNACVAQGGCDAYRPGDYGWGEGTRPVINVSWDDAQAYVKWLSQKTGAPYRLLSEAEREYVTRGCTSIDCLSTPFWFGAQISPDQANYDWRYSYNGSAKAQPPRRTVATGASAPNPFGLLQVHGNVREWVQDCWNDALSGIAADGAARMSGDCTTHVVRGGSWKDEPKDLRSAKRSWEMASERRAEIGFRVARNLRN